MADASAGGSSRWSRSPEDLTGEWTLHTCARIEFDGRTVPTIGKIALLARLGQGGMGAVYFGVHPRLGSEVAVKILPHELTDRQPAAVERFLREARLAARLRSEHLVGVLDVDRDEASGCHYLVMEYVRGTTAGALVRAATERGARGLAEAEALDLAIAAARGLAAAHVEGVLHRDLKPDNLLVPVAADGTVLFEKAKLADLGLARAEGSQDGLTVSESVLGTPGYMAPEQAKDAKSVQKPADVFGLGATLYALLAGEAPFRGATTVDSILRTVRGEHVPLREVRADVSGSTAALVESCLAADPAQRFPDAPALLEALQLCRNALHSRGDAATVSGLDLLRRREERGKRVVPDPLATPTPRPLPEGAEPIADLPVAAAPAVRPAVAPTASAVRAAVAPPAPGPRAHAPTPSHAGRRAPPPRRNGIPVWLASAALLLLAAVVGFLALRGREGPPPGLVVESDPGGAAVTLDGTVVGTTPCFVAALEGTHALRIELAGHEPFDAPALTVAAGERKVLRPALARRVTEEGLEVLSEPPGAAVAIDGRPSGRAPLYDARIAAGTHDVEVSFPDFRAWTDRVVVEVGRKTTVRAVLQRATGSVVVEGGPAGARIVLTRDGEEPAIEFTLDANGAARQELEAGAYSAHATCPGHDPWIGTVAVLPGDAPTDLRLALRERDGAISADSLPPGASVSVDGMPLGTTPLRAVPVAAGRRVVRIAAPGYAPTERRVRVRGDETTDLGQVRLVPPTRLSFAELEKDVVVRFGSAILADGAVVEPGEVTLVLERPDHAPQTVVLTAEEGKAAVVRAAPWERFQARLDLSALPEGTVATWQGQPLPLPVATWSATQEIALRLQRPGHEPIDLTLAVTLGTTARPPEELHWVPIETRLDLSGLGFPVTVDGRTAQHGMLLSPGAHRLQWTTGAPARFGGRVTSTQLLKFTGTEVVAGTQRWIRVPVHRRPDGPTALALSWLRAHQSGDGHWGVNTFHERCTKNVCSTLHGDAQFDIGVTALALLAFLEAGVQPDDSEFGAVLRSGIPWLVRQQGADGAVGKVLGDYRIYNQAVGALALVEAYRLSGGDEWKAPAQLAVKWVQAAQTPYLGWKYRPGGKDCDTSVTGWMVQVLDRAREAGLAVDAGAFVGAEAWIDRMTDPEFGRVGYDKRGGPSYRVGEMAARFPAHESEAMTASGALTRLACRRGESSSALQKDEFLSKAADLVVKKLPRWDEDAGSIDFCYWYLGTRFLADWGGNPWKKWRDAFASNVEVHQHADPDRDECGSWDPVDAWSTAGGRVYATAINCLAVQALGR